MQLFGYATFGIALLTLIFNAVFWIRSIQGFRFWKNLVRKQPDPEGWPRAHVVVCLKGNLPQIEETVVALDRQDYPGEYRVTFVTESDAKGGDVAAHQLAAMLPGTCRSDHKVAGRVLESGARCSQKNHNLLAGIRHARERHGGSEILAFCDGDLLVQPSWLREMARPLAIGASEASTSFHYTASDERRLMGALHGLAETCQSLASLVCRGATWGGSTAILDDVFRRSRLDEIWSRTVVDDMTMSRVLKQSGLKVTPVAQFLVCSRSEIQSYGSFVRWLGRQFFFVKIYLRSLYRLLWIKMGLNLATLWLGLFHSGYRILKGEWPGGPVAGWAVVLMSAAMILAFHCYRYLIPKRPPLRAWFGASLLVPGASLLACADATLRRKRLTWQDLTYFVERDGRVTRVTPSRKTPVPEETPVAEETPVPEVVA